MQDNERLDPRNLTFSQAQGYEGLPGPLALEELSSDARHRLWDLLYIYLRRSSGGGHLGVNWRAIAAELHREFLEIPLEEFRGTIDEFLGIYRYQILEDLEFNKVFDVLQIIMRHPKCPSEFTVEVKALFEYCQLAYCVDTNGPPTIFPMATWQEGEAITDAMHTLSETGLDGARTHLRKATELINQGDWPGSIRESIHSVESVARTLAPESASTLAPALKSLEERKHIHPALKDAFSKLYGYTSDEEGIRHALLDHSASPSGRDEAVFMLGVCASFASYLWRATQESDG